MPHEKINHGVSNDNSCELVVGWDRIGWVQVSIYPEGWSHTGEAMIVDLNPRQVEVLIKTLRRARRQAYGDGQRWPGFSENPADNNPGPTPPAP